MCYLHSMTYETTPYRIINDEEQTQEICNFRKDCWFEQALIWLGFHLERTDGECIDLDDDSVKEYSLLDSSDNSLVFSFFDSFYENACLKALTELGYSVEEVDDSNIVQVDFSGIVA